MGLLDSLESMAGQGQNAKIAGGFLQELEQHPGGIGAVINNMQQNGMDQHVQNWSSGQQQTTTPEQAGQALDGTGLVEKTAQRVGVSPQVVQMAMATVLPMVIAHFAPGGQATSQGAFGGIASTILGKIL